jgi:hypothetical protein
MCCLAAVAVKASLHKDKKTLVRFLKLPVDYGALCSTIEAAFAECAVEDFEVHVSASSSAEKQLVTEGWSLTAPPADVDGINVHVSAADALQPSGSNHSMGCLLRVPMQDCLVNTYPVRIVL